VPDEAAATALLAINPMLAQQILGEMPDEKRCAVLAAAPIEKAHQWMHNQQYPEDSVGWLMEPPVAVFRPQMTIRETIEALRVLTKKAFITYGYVTDDHNKLLGVLVMRDLMLGRSRQAPERCDVDTSLCPAAGHEFDGGHEGVREPALPGVSGVRP